MVSVSVAGTGVIHNRHCDFMSTLWSEKMGTPNHMTPEGIHHVYHRTKLYGTVRCGTVRNILPTRWELGIQFVEYYFSAKNRLIGSIFPDV